MSFVNKSSKKFAPKAQARPRPRPAATTEGTPAPTSASISTPITSAVSPSATRPSPARSVSTVPNIITSTSGTSTSDEIHPVTQTSRSISPVLERARTVSPVVSRTALPNKSNITLSDTANQVTSTPGPSNQPTVDIGLSTTSTDALARPPPISIQQPTNNEATASTTPLLQPETNESLPTSTSEPTIKRRKIQKDKGIAIRIPGQAQPVPPTTTPVTETIKEPPSSNAVADPPSSSTQTKAKRKRTKKNAAGTEGAGADGQPEAPKRRGRKRATTPENAADIEIEPGLVRMLDLCKDTFIGKKSERYKEIEKIDWTELVRKQRARRAENEARLAAGLEVQVETLEQRLERLGKTNAVATSRDAMIAPQMRLVNGQLVLDEQSLQIDRRERDAVEDEPLEQVEESNLTRRVNNATWRNKERTERWDAEETNRFYGALSMFGTDFEMCSKMFPGRTRRQLKNKFTAEERRNPGRITQSLKRKVSVDMDEYSFMAQCTFRPVEDVENELEKIRQEHEASLELSVRQGSELAKERNAAATMAMNGTQDSAQQMVSAPKKQRKGTKRMPISRQEGEGEVILGMIA